MQRRNLTEERKPAKSEPGTSTGNQSPMVATAAVAPPSSSEVKSSDGDGSKQTTTKRPAEVSVSVIVINPMTMMII